MGFNAGATGTKHAFAVHVLLLVPALRMGNVDGGFAAAEKMILPRTKMTAVHAVPTASKTNRDKNRGGAATTTTASIGRRHALLKTVAAGVATASLLPPPRSCTALTPAEAERQYDVYAASYDELDGGRASSVLGIAEARSFLLQKARGKVLEIGVGTGLNLDKYSGQQISSLTLVDISSGMLSEARAKVQSLPNLRGVEVDVVRADATAELVDRFGSESFDTVVDSFSLCVLGNDGARRCLDQIGQMVKTRENGGRVLLLENSRSSNLLLGLYQDATADMAANAGGKGCVYNQDVGSMIRATGRLRIVDETEYAAGLFRSFECVRN